MENLFNILIYLFALVLVTLPISYPFIIKEIRILQRKKREEKLLLFAKKTGAVVKPFWGQIFKDCGDMKCFVDLYNPSFCNVIEKLDKMNGNVYIGELQGEIIAKNIIRKISRYNHEERFSALSSSNNDLEKDYMKLIKDSTLCVVYDDRFNFPSFELFQKNFEYKLANVFAKKDSEVIDFEDDKNFSNTWVLTSNENISIKELFNKNIRSNFMKFVNKGYRICGKRNVLFIVTTKVIGPEDYSKVISDVRTIHRFMKDNKKFYSLNS